MRKEITRMKLLFVGLISALLIVGCSDMKDDITDLQKRVDTVESAVGELQKAIDAGKLVTSVTAVTDSETGQTGWEMLFSDGEKIVIYNGESGKVITDIVENDNSFTITIDGKPYVIGKAVVLPTSITMLQSAEFVFKGESVDVGVVINPGTTKIYPKESISLKYVPSYLATRGLGQNPDFIKVTAFEPTDVLGEYTLTLSWNKSDAEFAKNAPIFIELAFTDAENKPSTIVSSTPVILSEKFKSITLDNVAVLPDVYMFSDETFTDSIDLLNYHPDYVDVVDYQLGMPKILKPIIRFLPTDKYQFSIQADNTLWANADQKRVTTPVTVTVTDNGVAAVLEKPARPELGLPAKPAIPAIPAKSVERGFNVHVYRVAADNILYTENWGEKWLPNTDMSYSYTKDLEAILGDAGYNPANWTFEITGYKHQLDGGAVANALPATIVADMSGFTATSKNVKFNVTSRVDYGVHQIKVLFKATSVKPRQAPLSNVRTFEVAFQFTLVPPHFEIKLNNTGILASVTDNVFQTSTIDDVNIKTLFDVNSNKNVSKKEDVTPNVEPFSYRYDMTEVQGAQGVKFTPYPAVKKPAMSFATHFDAPVKVFVKLETGQSIPVTILRPDNSAKVNTTGDFIVRYARLNLDHVEAVVARFAGNYDVMLTKGIDLTLNNNFTPHNSAHVVIDPTQIKKVSFAASGFVTCENGDLPSGLENKQIMSVDPVTGVVKTVPPLSWSNESLIMRQTFVVTYEDVWGNSKSTNVIVRVKSNSIP